MEGQTSRGSSRNSNLFNKISLTILAADFFQSLCERGVSLDREDQIPDLVRTWLVNVNSRYFDKDWKLGGIKKDSVGIRNQWAYLWEEHRRGGNLPRLKDHRTPRNL